MKTVTTVTTEKMGSCQCGDCYCEIRKDGAIRYVGNEHWQTSGWLENPVFPQDRRPYGSQLVEDVYLATLGILAEKNTGN